MSKKDLIEAVAKDADLTKDKATAAVDAMLKHIEASMKSGGEVRIPGFGTFKVGKRVSPTASSSRSCSNPSGSSGARSI